MTPHADYVTVEKCATIRDGLQRANATFRRWLVTGLASVIITCAIPVSGMVLQKYVTDARQDEKIDALEKREEMLRAELAEMRADIKILVQRSGK